MKKRHKVLTVLAITLTLVGTASAGWFDTGDQSKDELAGEVDTSGIDVGTSFWTEMEATEANQQDLVTAEPIPKMEDSLERNNLINRYKTLNDQNEIFHVYLLSHGKVVSYFTAQGKVSSVNSKLTQPEQIVKDDGHHGSGEQNDHVVSSPQLDGSYGTNGDGKFFFDTSGAYIETNMEYIVSQRPLNIRTPPVIETSVNATTR
jgi:hypothetical protein